MQQQLSQPGAWRSAPHHVLAAFILRLEHGEESGRLNDHTGQQMLHCARSRIGGVELVLRAILTDDLPECKPAREYDAPALDEVGDVETPERRRRFRRVLR